MKLIAIGHLGSYTVYIGLTKNEAIQKYNQENPSYKVEENDLSVRELDVNDKFYVYDIWENE